MKRNFFIYLLIFIVIILAGTCVFLFYKYENYVIWGITAKILENFLEFLEV